MNKKLLTTIVNNYIFIIQYLEIVWCDEKVINKVLTEECV